MADLHLAQRRERQAAFAKAAEQAAFAMDHLAGVAVEDQRSRVTTM